MRITTDRLRFGYTLTEILVTFVVIGVFASLILPRLVAHKETAYFMEALANARSLYSAEKIYWLEHNRSFAGINSDCSNLDYQANVSANFSAPACNVGGGNSGEIRIARSNGTYTLIVDANGSLTCPACPGNLSKLLP